MALSFLQKYQICISRIQLQKRAPQSPTATRTENRSTTRISTTTSTRIWKLLHLLIVIVQLMLKFEI